MDDAIAALYCQKLPNHANLIAFPNSDDIIPSNRPNYHEWAGFLTKANLENRRNGSCKQNLDPRNKTLSPEFQFQEENLSRSIHEWLLSSSYEENQLHALTFQGSSGPLRGEWCSPPYFREELPKPYKPVSIGHKESSLPHNTWMKVLDEYQGHTLAPWYQRITENLDNPTINNIQTC